MAGKLSLDDVVGELIALRGTSEDTNKSLDNLADSTMKMFKMFDRKFDRDSLNDQEKRRENEPIRIPNKNKDGGEIIPEADKNNFLRTVLRGTFLGTLAARVSAVLAPLVAGIAANIVSPLKLLGRAVLRGGPVGAAIGLLYSVFKDIGDNPAFSTALEGIDNIWNNEVIPTWNRLREVFTNFLSTKNVQATVSSISHMWTSSMAWFSDTFKPAMQTLLVDNINVFGGMLSGVIEAVNQILDGDIIGGIGTIFNTLVTTVVTNVDNFATAIARMFGVKFAEGSSVFSHIGDMGNRIADTLSNMTQSIGATISDKLGGIGNWFSTQFATVLDAFDIISLKFNNGMDNVQIGFERVSNYIQNIPDRLLRMIGRILDFEIPRLSIPYDNYLLGQGEIVLFPGGRPFASAGEAGMEASNRIAGRNNEMNASIAKLEATIASRLEELNNIRAENQRGGNNVTIVAPSTSNSTQQNNTSVMSFPSPFNEYTPQ